MITPYSEILDHILIESEVLQKRIQEIGKEVSRDYQNAEQLILVCILKGSTLFLADLIRQIDIPHAIDFMEITSYGIGKRASTGDVRILMDLGVNIEGKDVLIVEDIVDSGNTLDSVLRLLRSRQPTSLNVCALLDKHSRREIEIPLKYVGFEIPDVFVFGYGLDIDEYYRNLPFIGVVKDGISITR